MSKIERYYHDNGALRFESEFVDGVPNGLQRHWHPNGILAMEVPYNHGIIDGTVRQWNDKGELLATSELKNGTGVLRTLNPEQDTDGEMTYVDGYLTGRQRCYCGGELLATVYWLGNEKVPKKRYLEACKQNPNLPRYEDKPRSSAKSRGRKKTVKAPILPSKPSDELPLNLLQGPHVREALAWLEESREPSRSLGEATGQDESTKLVKKLYSLGAISVHAVEINGEPTEHQNTGRIVIELPQEESKRREIFAWGGLWAQSLGFDAEVDRGQMYLFVMMD